KINETLDAYGYSHRPYQLDATALPGLERAYLQDTMSRPAIPNAGPLGYYHKLVALLASRKIKVIFLQMPMLTTMWAEAPQIALRDPYERRVARLIQTEFPGTANLNYRSEDIAKPEY